MAGESDSPAIVVDARGHRCPTPTLKLRRALETAEIGATVILLADDPLARVDVPAFIQESGDEIVLLEENLGNFRFYIRKIR